MKLSDNKVRIISAVIIGIFIFSAILTVAVNYFGDDEDDDQTETIIDGKKYDDKTLADRYSDVFNKNQRDSDSDGNIKPSAEKEEQETDPMQELNDLIGLESVKAEVASLANFIRVQKAREAQGLKVPDISYHLVFSGNPGTGKTTVARILARIYKDLGVLQKGHLVETDRSGLIGEYVGQTAPKVNHICDSAMGGVLFIDEAYAITEKGAKGADYGGEAVATLLKRMEDNRDSLVVIVAGYTNEMKDFIDANPGLKSRFTRYLEFPDYSPEELYQIYMMRIDKYGFTMTDDAKNTLQEIMRNAVAAKDRNFGNGRYARNLFENTITAQSNRLGSGNVSKLNTNDLNTIIASDVINAYNQTRR